MWLKLTLFQNSKVTIFGLCLWCIKKASKSFNLIYVMKVNLAIFSPDLGHILKTTSSLMRRDRVIQLNVSSNTDYQEQIKDEEWFHHHPHWCNTTCSVLGRSSCTPTSFNYARGCYLRPIGTLGVYFTAGVMLLDGWIWK